MVILTILISCVIGEALYGHYGLLLGGLFGFISGMLVTLYEKIRHLNDKVIGLEKKLQQPGEAEQDILPPVAEPETLTHATAKPAEVTQEYPSLKKHIVAKQRNSSVKQMDPWLSSLIEYFTTGNIVAKVGVLILLLGMAFLLSFAAKHTSITIESRVVGAVVAGVVLFFAGWFFRKSRRNYGLCLQGGGLGILYLTTYSAFRIFNIIPQGSVAIVLLLALVVIITTLALVEDSEWLAILGLVGGFLAPILIGNQAGNATLIFGYFTLLNVAILFIINFKPWRALNLLGFIFTFGIATYWGISNYTSEKLYICEAFLVISFVIYIITNILTTINLQINNQRNQCIISGMLTFGVPIISLAAQAYLVSKIPYALASSALLAGVFYFILSRVLKSRAGEPARLLAETFLIISIVLLSVAIPLAFSATWTSAIWALEGAGMIWLSVKQGRLIERILGGLLQLGAGISYALDMYSPITKIINAEHYYLATTPILNSYYMSTVIIAIAAIFSAYYLYKDFKGRWPWEKNIALLFYAWSILWWVWGGMREIGWCVQGSYVPYQLSFAIDFFAISCLVCWIFSEKLKWSWLRYPALAILPIMIMFAVMYVEQFAAPFVKGGFIAWPLIFAAMFYIWYRHDKCGMPLSDYWHAIAIWLLCWLLTWQVQWIVSQYTVLGSCWRVVMPGLVPALFMFIIQKGEGVLRWPLNAHRGAYLHITSSVLTASIMIWTLYVNFNLDGNVKPLPFIPLLNPLDITVAICLLSIYNWPARAASWLKQINCEITVQHRLAIMGVWIFIWSNATLLRTLHNWYLIPFTSNALLSSRLVQSSLSIFWAVLALIITAVAARWGWRGLWMCGASLIALLLAKLLFIDLFQIDTIERIISFIGVGVLLIVVGYISPAPPKK